MDCVTLVCLSRRDVPVANGIGDEHGEHLVSRQEARVTGATAVTLSPRVTRVTGVTGGSRGPNHRCRAVRHEPYEGRSASRCCARYRAPQRAAWALRGPAREGGRGSGASSRRARIPQGGRRAVAEPRGGGELHRIRGLLYVAAGYVDFASALPRERSRTRTASAAPASPCVPETVSTKSSADALRVWCSARAPTVWLSAICLRLLPAA
jgi:hypothetical protein